MKPLNILLIASASVRATVTDFRASDIIADTNQGPVLGVQVHDRVNAFLGVRYAQPPIDDLRFQSPQPLLDSTNSSKETFNATSFGPACHQFMYRSVLGDSSKPSTPESEDCLTLNVYVPKQAAQNCDEPKLLPVYVWSYGGGSGEGAGSVPLYDPTKFVAENEDIIVVTWNYRLTIFGFPNSPALEEQNLGVRDQRAALEWLRDNLPSFGGDPQRITLGGHSAGSATGHAMLYSYPREPIVAGLVLQSGVIETIGANTGNADYEFVRVAESVGCANLDRAAELKCMKKVNAARLKHAISNHTLNNFGSPHGGWPMVDNVTIFTNEEYSKRGKAGDFAQLPMLIGTMHNEGDGVLNWDPDEGVNRTASDIHTETVFECNTALESRFRVLNKVPVWRYLYRGVFPEVTPYPWLRAYHGAEIPMLMGTYNLMEPSNNVQSNTTTTGDASKILQHLFGAFVRDPAHGLWESYRLPTFQPGRKTLLELFPDNKPTMQLATVVEKETCADPDAIAEP